MKKIIDGRKLNIIVEKVKKARIKANLSQAELSAKLELLPVYICRGSIQRIDNGDRMINDIEIDGISKENMAKLNYLMMIFKSIEQPKN